MKGIIFTLAVFLSGVAHGQDIYISAPNGKAWGGYPRVNLRTAWYWGWSTGVQKKFINFELMKQRDQQKPVKNSRPIILDIEPNGISRSANVDQVYQAVSYYTSRYPNNKVAVYRTFPLLKGQIWNLARWHKVRNNRFDPNYGKYFSEYLKVIQDLNRTRFVTKKTDFITTRAYVPYEKNMDVYWRSMEVYHELARAYDDPVMVFLRPKYLDTGNWIPPKRWKVILERARDIWKVDKICIFTLGEMPDELQKVTFEFEGR